MASVHTKVAVQAFNGLEHGMVGLFSQSRSHVCIIVLSTETAYLDH